MSFTQTNFYKKFLGRKGEDEVTVFLEKQGYKTVKRNFSTKFGEVDIIVEKDGELVFVEVKTRSQKLFGEPKEAVGKQKREKYRKVAEYYISKYGEKPVTFAVAEVTPDGINLITDAF